MDVKCIMSATIYSSTEDVQMFFKVYDTLGVKDDKVESVIFLYGFDYDLEIAKEFIPQAVSSIIRKADLNGFKVKVFITKETYSIILATSASEVTESSYKLIRYAWDNDDKVVRGYLITDNPNQLKASDEKKT